MIYIVNPQKLWILGAMQLLRLHKIALFWTPSPLVRTCSHLHYRTHLFKNINMRLRRLL